MTNQIEEAALFLTKQLSEPFPSTALVLGSGLGEIGDQLENQKFVETSQIPHWPVSTVPGHRGRVVLGGIEGESVLVLQGRVHYYEGYTIQEVVFPIRVIGRLGIRKIILTNAAGSLRSDFRPGDLMLIEDHINFMGTNPLIGINRTEWGPRFPDLSEVYEPEYISQAKTIGQDLGLSICKGVLAGMCGPSYETAAECRMLRQIGADAVTMSTIPEAIAAVQMGMRVLGVSFISNYATGVSSQKLSHREVEANARKFRGGFQALVRSTAVRISKSG